MLHELLQLSNGARFYRVDLHNHTPADPAFNCGNRAVDTEEQKKAFAREYVRFLKDEQGIEIVGIAEHNDVSWLPYIQDAAEEIGLVVFPGVELGAKDGKRQVHFLALFDPGTPSEQMDHFISSLGLVPKGRFQPDGSPRLVQMDTRELTQHIVRTGTQLHGITIAAHASSKNGLFRELEGEARVLAYLDSHLIAVEIPGTRDELADFERKLVNGEADHYGNKAVACLNQSDGRGLTRVNPGCSQIGSRFTNIKLSDLSVEALRQAFTDFDSRIRLEGEYRQERYPRLLGLIVEGGFLDAKPKSKTSETDVPALFMLHLNPNLNTIVGGRGTGKSALLESIRYVFDLPPRTEETQRQSRRIIDATLPAGARITAFYELADGTRYKITRLKGHDPEVYDVETGEKKEVCPADVLPGGVPVEVYGQKEIFEISKYVDFQLNLLDTYVAEALRDIRQEESELLRWLNANAADILRLQDDVDQAEQRLRELEGIRLELERMEKRKAVAQLESKKQAEREKTLLDRAEEAVTGQTQALKQFKAQHEPLRELLPDDLQREGLPHTEMLQVQAALLERMDEAFTGSLDALQQQLETIWGDGAGARGKWQKDYQSVQQAYEDLLAELDEDFSGDRYFEQRAKLQALEGIQREMERRQQRLGKLRKTRTRRLNMLRRLRHTREFRVRRKKAIQLTEHLRGTGQRQSIVRFTLTLEGNREADADKLAELFAGHRITKSVFDQLATARLLSLKGTLDDKRRYADQVNLARAIRCEQENPAEEDSILAQVYDISPAYRKRLTSVDEETLYHLEAYRIPDLPDIALRVGDEYRSLNPAEGERGLSTGQKCTAILSLILVERDAPLVIDQPEDDLDNEFIFREIVQTLRREKERRQFIVATHNANIPVSGDAELIVVMQADQYHGWAEHLGSIDDPAIREPVENILEGGKEAFRIRQAKYQILE